MNTLKVEIIIPDWVNWIAVDKGGECYGYEEKPVARAYGSWGNPDFTKKAVIIYASKPPKNWKDELYTWS